MATREVECLTQAGTQFGVVSRAEVLRFLSPKQLERRLASGLLTRVFPRVYRAAGAPAGWRQTVEALSLWAGPKAVLSHRTAAALYGFTHFQEGPLEVTLLAQRRVPAGVKAHRVRQLSKKDVGEAGGLRATSVERTLIDLAVKSDRYTMRASVDEALRQKWTTLEDLRPALARARRYRRLGAPELSELIREFDGGDGPGESELEEVMFALIESAGLPKPTRQKPGHSGDKRVRVDLLFETHGVIIEGDGYATHSGVDSFEADRERDNLLTASGYLVLHWTWTAMHAQPEELINVLIATLNSRVRRGGR